MNRIAKYILILVFIVLMSSCATKEKFTIYGPPATEIYMPSGELLTTIDHSGNAEVKITSDGYFAYLLAKSSDSDLVVPFALDYQRKEYILIKSGVSFWGPFVAGYAMTFAGFIEARDQKAGIKLNKEPHSYRDDNYSRGKLKGYTALGIIGIVPLVWSFTKGLVDLNKAFQFPVEHRFAYDKRQYVNSDFHFLKPNFVDYSQLGLDFNNKTLNTSLPDTKTTYYQPSIANNPSNNSGSNIRQNVVDTPDADIKSVADLATSANQNDSTPSSRSGRTLAKKEPSPVVTTQSNFQNSQPVSAKPTKPIDYAKAVHGKYSGSGSLSLNGKVIESYSKIQVILDRTNDTEVYVNVIEGGTPYFEADELYTVQRLPDGSYMLTNQNVPEAYIKVGSNGMLIYVHPKVNIEGNLYQLEVKNARK